MAGDVPVWLVRVVAFVMGALWGSFFNVAIYRWPRGMSVVSPPSHCPACGAPVRWYLNVPVFGYALLGRRGFEEVAAYVAGDVDHERLRERRPRKHLGVSHGAGPQAFLQFAQRAAR